MSEDEVKLLNIKFLQQNDTGVYLCRVLNEYGYADLIHYLNVLPGKINSMSSIYVDVFFVFFQESKRPSFLFNDHRIGLNYFLTNLLSYRIIIIITCIIALTFIIFLIYHFRNQKNLRQTLLATRILATRGINTMKNVSLLIF